MSNKPWEGRRVVVCLGTGGVGKTTVAAAVALAAAADGKRTLVMTIDPARRLGQALGLTSLGAEPQRIDAARLAAYGLTLTGELHVMMPEVKRTFDAVVRRWAPDAARAEVILNNEIYAHFSTALAGSHEYAAVEKLYEVYSEGAYDLIVLDTPPSQNAIAFLQAPGRILDFLDAETLGFLARPTRVAGRLSLRLLDMGGSVLLRLLGKLAGAQTMAQLIEFMMAFQSMYDGFRERSQRVQALLTGDEAAFWLVSAPQPNQLAAVANFRQQLLQARVTVRGTVLNRVHAWAVQAQAFVPLEARVAQLLPDVEARQTVLAALRAERALGERDAAALRTLRARCADEPILVLPELPRDVHDLAGLAHLQQCIAAS